MNSTIHVTCHAHVWCVCVVILLTESFCLLPILILIYFDFVFLFSYPFLIGKKPHPYKFGYEIEDGYGGKNSRHESGDDYGNVVCLLFEIFFFILNHLP